MGLEEGKQAGSRSNRRRSQEIRGSDRGVIAIMLHHYFLGASLLPRHGTFAKIYPPFVLMESCFWRRQGDCPTLPSWRRIKPLAYGSEFDCGRDVNPSKPHTLQRHFHGP